MDGAHYEEQTALRRAAVPSDNYEVELKKRRLDGVKPVTYETNLDNLPGDFISNTSRVPPPSPPGDPAVDSTDATDASSVKRTAVDLEWENFQQTVLGAPRREDLFERATISAAPDVSDVSQGFPSSLGDTNLARISDRLEGEIDRERRERDEVSLAPIPSFSSSLKSWQKELIMDRLFDEEQAQEEADTKVVVMKGRLTALKNRRRAAKDARQKISLQ
jgi:zinc finger protein 830